MNDIETKLFYKMACMYEQVGELTIDNDAALTTIIKLGEKNNWKAINTLFNEYNEFYSGEDLFTYYFDITLHRLNLLADEFEFQRIERE